jgi:hypothetical protein
MDLLKLRMTRHIEIGSRTVNSVKDYSTFITRHFVGADGGYDDIDIPVAESGPDHDEEKIDDNGEVYPPPNQENIPPPDSVGVYVEPSKVPHTRYLVNVFYPFRLGISYASEKLANLQAAPPVGFTKYVTTEVFKMSMDFGQYCKFGIIVGGISLFDLHQAFMNHRFMWIPFCILSALAGISNWWLIPIWFLCLLNPASFVRNLVHLYLRRQMKLRRVAIAARFKRLNLYLACDNQHILSPMIWVHFAPIVVGSILAYKVYRKLIKGSEQVPEASDFIHESPYNEDLNVHELRSHCGKSYSRIKPEYAANWNTRMDNVTLPVHTDDPKSLMRAISPNIRLCHVITAESTRGMKTHIFGIQGAIGVINRHALPLDISTAIIRVAISGDPATTATHDVRLAGNYKILKGDLVLVRFSGILFRDVLKHFVSEDLFPSNTVICVDKDTCVSAKKIPHTSIGDDKLGTVNVTSPYSYQLPGHYRGLCGVPRTTGIGNRSYILGLHIGGSKSTPECLLEAIDRKTLVDAIASFEGLFEDYHSEGSLDMTFLDPPKRSPVRHIDLNGLTYFGHDGENVCLNNKTQIVRRQGVLDGIVGDLIPARSQFFAPARLKPFRMGDTYISPYNIALEAISDQRMALNRPLLREVADEYIAKIIGDLPSDTKLDPWDVDSAVNGVNCDAYARRINVTTAAGYGYPGKKSNYLPISVEMEDSLTREPVSSIKKDVVAILDRYSRGETANPVFKGCIKDELRPVDKVRTGKSRMFYAGNLAHLIVARMYLNPLFTLMCAYGDAFGTSVGIDMHKGSHQFVVSFEKFSYFLEGDYSKFDQRRPCEIGEATMYIVIYLLRRFGYNEYAITIVRGLFTDACFPLVNVLGDMFLVAGLHTSGSNGTAEINGIANNLMVRYAYRHCRALRPYDEVVKTTTYGDDLLSGLDESIIHVFNAKFYQKFCKVAYNMDFTDAKKRTDIRPYIRLDEASFLKRNFVYRREFGRYVAPLDINSLIRMMDFRTISSFITEQDHLVESSKSFLWEIFFHYERDKFDEIRDKLISNISPMLERADMGEVLPTWSEIVAKLGFNLVGSQESLEQDMESRSIHNTH